MTTTLTARCTMNEAPLDGEGGRIVLHCNNNEAKQLGFSQVEVILNALTDAAMQNYPSERSERQNTIFMITIVKLTPAGLPERAKEAAV